MYNRGDQKSEAVPDVQALKVSVASSMPNVLIIIARKSYKIYWFLKGARVRRFIVTVCLLACLFGLNEIIALLPASRAQQQVPSVKWGMYPSVLPPSASINVDLCFQPAGPNDFINEQPSDAHSFTLDASIGTITAFSSSVVIQSAGISPTVANPVGVSDYTVAWNASNHNSIGLNYTPMTTKQIPYATSICAHATLNTTSTSDVVSMVRFQSPFAPTLNFPDTTTVVAQTTPRTRVPAGTSFPSSCVAGPPQADLFRKTSAPMAGLYECTVTGTPGTWALVANAATGLLSINGDTTSAQIITTTRTADPLGVSTAGGTTSINVPDASSGTPAGLVTNGIQAFGGIKSFTNNVDVAGILSSTNVAAAGINAIAPGKFSTFVANDSGTGTVNALIAKLTGAPATARTVTTSDTSGAIGIVVSTTGTTGSALIATGGTVQCQFDGATTAGHYVQISSTSAGKCHDSGANYPTSGQLIGRVFTTNGSSGTYDVLVAPEIQSSVAINGTANQITATGTNPVTLSIPSVFKMPSTANVLNGALYRGTGLRTFGDSITAANQAFVTTSFHAIVSTAAGWGDSPDGLNGAMGADRAGVIYGSSIVEGDTDYTQVILFYGTNEAINWGDSVELQDAYKHELQSLAGWLSLSIGGRTKGNALTTAGTWGGSTLLEYNSSSADPYGIESTTNGSTATGTFIGSVGFISTALKTGNGGTFTVTVDGVSTGQTYNCFASTSVTSGAGTNNTPYMIPLSGYAPGVHTVVATVTSATNAANKVFIQWIGGNEGRLVTTGPHVYIASNYRLTAAGYGIFGGGVARSAAYNEKARQAAKELAAYGLPVTFVDAYAAIDNPDGDLIDNLHPTNGGQGKLGAAFAESLQQAARVNSKMAAVPLVPRVRALYVGAVGTTTLSLSRGTTQQLTFGAGNETLALSNLVDGETYTLVVIQDGTGSRTITWPATIKWVGGTAPTLSTGANARDQFVFLSNGTNLYELSRALDVK